jgi:hypothetical protein
MRLITIGVAAIMVTAVAACSGGPSTAAAPPATTAAAPPATTAVAPATTAPTPTTAATVNYGQQFLDDESGWDAAIKAAVDATLASALSHAAGVQAVACARLLLTQSWPAADVSDIHTLAAQFEVINSDIQIDDNSKYVADGTQLNADANVVRAELGLPAIGLAG